MSRVRLPHPSFYQTLFWSYLAILLVVFTFAIPPFQKADEPAHFERSVSLTNLELTCKKDENGKPYFAMKRKFSDLPDVMHIWDVALDYNHKFQLNWLLLRGTGRAGLGTQQSFSDPRFSQPGRVYDFCGLPPLGYIPNAIGVLAGKPFVNPLVSFYLGRVAGVVFFLGLLIAALRVAPQRYRGLIYVYAALPMVLHQVSALSYDVVQLSLFPLMFAYMTRFMVESRPIKTSSLVIFLALLWWNVNVRLLSYLPLLLLFFCIDRARVATRFSTYARLAVVFMALSLATAGLLAYVYLAQSTGAPVLNNSPNAAAQIRFILRNPYHFLTACYATLHFTGEQLLWQNIGFFGWLDWGFNYFPYYLAVFLGGFGLYMFMDRDELVLKPYQLLAMLGAIFLTVIALFGSLYVVWSPVGADMVLGLQGRYFVGLVPFTVLAVSQLALMVGKERLIQGLILIAAVVMLFNVIHGIDLRYYRL